MNLFVSDFNLQAWRYIQRYDPQKAPDVTLFYGPKGIGKSLLLRYLLRRMNEREGTLFAEKEGTLLIEAGTFSRHYGYAAQENKLKSFRQRYRTARLLLIDDLQLLAGKEKTLEELQSTYEEIVQNGGKIVASLTADTLQLDFLGKRLASRFLGGVIIPLLKPQGRELENFITSYVWQEKFLPEPEISGFIAEHTDNLAEAVNIIEQFVSYAEMKQDVLSWVCFREYWQQRVRQQQMAAEPHNIIKKTAEIMGIPEEELTGPGRNPEAAEARNMAIYVIRTLCHLSYPGIAGYFRRSHSTIMASHKKISEQLTKNRELEVKYRKILEFFTEK